MLKDLGLDLDLTRSKKPFKVQLALPSKVITQNILNINTANISDVKLNSLPHFEFEIPYLVESKNKGVTDEIEYIKNPDLDNIKEEKLIKLTWYGGRINWFRIMTIEKNDSSEGISTKISCDSLESELRKTNVTIDGTGIGAEEYFSKALEQSPWKLGYISNKLKNTYRTFSEQDKQTRYEAIQSGIESYGAITDFDGETRTLNLLTIDELRIFRGVVLKRENYASSIDITSTSEEIVTRMYGKGNENLDISSANPTGMRYIEDFSYFIHPFKRDANKNVLEHSAYMSDGLAHALLDLMELEKIYNPKIDDLQKLINQAYVDLTKKMTEKVDLDGEMLTLQALLDTAKSTNNKPLITQRQTEIVAKQKQIDSKVSEINSINASIELWNKTIVDYQEIISTNSFEPKLVEELKLFVYEKDFSDDRYIDAKELYEATVKEFEKYQKPTRSFKTDLVSFINSIESKKYHGRLEIGEEVKIKSEKLGEEYTSIILGYSGDLISGDFQLEISDNMDDIDALDRLATIIYQAESSSSILSNNKYKWNNIVEVKDEVTAWRDKEINTVNNRIVAGANESITLDNRGMMVRNPDFPDEVIIIQSGVVALSRDNGKTWNTSITPNGVIADTLIGKILAGNNLIITNDSGSFVIDNTGMTVNMDSIRIMSGDEGDPKNIIESWNKLLLTYNEIASDSLVNEYEKNQLKLQWNKIEDIHSSMIASFLKGWSQKPVTEPDPNNPNPNPEPNYPDEYGIYIKAYEDLNTYLNTTKQSDGYALLDEANKTKTTTIDSEEFKKKFLDYDKAKQALESIISFTYAYSQIKVLEAGISLEYVKNDNIVTALNLSEEGVKIDGKLLEINSKTEFNADLVMNAGVIKGKDDGIIIDLNTGEIKLNKKVTIGTDSNLVTDDDITPLKGTIVSTLSNNLATIFTDTNGSSGNYDYALTEMNIYKDGFLDNNNWTFSVERNSNVIYTITKNLVKVLSIKTNSETLVIVAKQGKDTLREEFRINKYAGTTVDVNRWMIVPDVIHKTIHNEWVGTPLVIMGNEQLVGKDTKPYSGRYKVYESKDGGINYSVKYTSSANESMISYKPTEADVTHIKVQFYLAGSTLNLIDEQVLPVVVDKSKMYSHIAWAYSADGTDRFTTVYPNLNLVDGTTFKNYTPKIQQYLSMVIKNGGVNNEPYVSISYNNPTANSYTDTISWGFDKEYFKPSTTYTFSFYLKGNGTIRTHVYPSLIDASSVNGLADGKAITPVADGNYDWNLTSDWVRHTYTFVTKSSITEGQNFLFRLFTGNSADICLPKVEEGSVATPHMPSSSEVTTADWPSYIGQYTDFAQADSTNPSDYTWSLIRGNDGKDGANGKDGIAGKDGIGIKNTVITYAISISGTTAPTTGWTSSVPSLVKGQYLWTKTVWTYTDNSSETGYTVSYISKDGNNGTDGLAGKDGVGIKTTAITYASHTNGTTAPTTGYTATVPSVPAGQFLWTKTIWTYTDNSTETGYSVAMMGLKGDKGDTGASGRDGIAGKDGKGIKATAITYQESTNGTTPPTGTWSATVPPVAKGNFLWTRTIWTYTDNTTETGYAVAYMGTNGNNGNDGIAGKDGVGIKTTTITYAGSTSGTTAPTSGWTTTVPTVAAGSYMWTKTVWAYTDNTSETGYSVAKMGNDGTITHTAWSWSADGADRFTLNYPNLNQLNGSRIYSKSNPYVLTGNSVDTYVHLRDVAANLKAGTYTLSAKTDGVWVNHGSTNNPNDKGACLWLVSSENNINISLGNTVPQTINVPKDGTYCIRVNLYSDGTTNISRKFWDFKLDSGSIATPWMPSSSEVKTSDYPSYIGTYLDKNVESSLDYKRYQWTIFKGQDSNAYVAYSWNADGTDRFTTTYPNLNLLDGTKDFSGDWANSELSTDDGTYKGLTVKKRTGQWGGIFKKYTVIQNSDYTFSAFVKGYGTDTHIVRIVLINGVEMSSLEKTWTSTFDWERDSITFLAKNIKVGDEIIVRYEISVLGTNPAVWVAGYKLEQGSIVTPWMPSESEAQDQWQDAIPMYIGVGEKDSQNPSDYRWQLNSKYVQASSDSGLSNKAGVDDLSSVADTANDALVQAQNAVSNEDYTSWLEHDYQSTIDDLQDVSIQNQEDIRNVDDRTTAVEGFYDEMKIKWNFIDESFTFSEEGMFISNSQSKMAIQVTSDKIVFWDNDVDVAFITGEVLNIQRGVFLESATIGNHLITKFSDDSPVTIITYVGGIN